MVCTTGTVVKVNFGSKITSPLRSSLQKRTEQSWPIASDVAPRFKASHKFIIHLLLLQVAYILSLGVCEEFRKQGIASLLLENLISHLTSEAFEVRLQN